MASVKGTSSMIMTGITAFGSWGALFVDAAATVVEASAAAAKAGAAPAGAGVASAATGVAAVALALAARLVETSEETLVALLVAALGSARTTRLVAVIPMMLSRVALSFILLCFFVFGR